LTLEAAGAFLIEISIFDLLKHASPLSISVLICLLLFSLVSWAIIYSKWNLFRRARTSNLTFLRAFRKANGLEAAVAVARQHEDAPLVAVFAFGFEEVERQVKNKGTLSNKIALERSLQLGASEELAKLERHMNWLATTASVSPFIGLFGTVLGIIASFQALGQAGSASLRAVAPGISEALVATAAGLAAAIPAAIFYNHYGHVIREMGARMDDFSLEFMNLAERSFED
jgi:biopolymer transport protein TolQ